MIWWSLGLVLMEVVNSNRKDVSSFFTISVLKEDGSTRVAEAHRSRWALCSVQAWLGRAASLLAEGCNFLYVLFSCIVICCRMKLQMLF